MDNDAGYAHEDDEFLDDENECFSEDDGIGIDTNVAENDQSATDVQIISTEELGNEIRVLSEETASVVSLHPAVCKILLHYFKWNKEYLVEKFYDSENFLRSLDFEIETNFKKVGHPCRYRSGRCGICMEDDRQLTGLACSHRYCSDCWDQYLSTRFHDNQDPYVRCPDPDCKLIADDEIAMKLLQKPEDRKFYSRLLNTSFVDHNRLLKWCPAPDCDKVIKVSHPEFRPVTCDCQFCFCFNCSAEWHEPVSCSLLRKWIKKCSDDSETANWLHANTKDCPKCHVTIEKDGGCNHMTCKSVSCKFEFCWMCLGPWQPHGTGWYACNRFTDQAAQDARSVMENSRAALQRYLHYYNRYANHQNSLKLEAKLREVVESKMRQMQQHGFSWIETQFLTKSVKALNDCRRTLMYTYAFAFYLKPSNETEIFENNQADLELATEQLSEILEREMDVDVEKLKELKLKVQDKAKYVEIRRQKLLKHCAHGNERNTWEFRET